jgi:hypothetical protein
MNRATDADRLAVLARRAAALAALLRADGRLGEALVADNIARGLWEIARPAPVRLRRVA